MMGELCTFGFDRCRKEGMQGRVCEVFGVATEELVCVAPMSLAILGNIWFSSSHEVCWWSRGV